MTIELSGISGLFEIAADELGGLFAGVQEADLTPIFVRRLGKPLSSVQQERLAKDVSSVPAHAGLITVLAARFADGTSDLICGPREGETLADHIKPLMPEDAIALTTQLAQALGELHGHGLVHGAVHPGAVIGRPLRWALVDAGVAVAVQLVPPAPLSVAGAMASHLAPEVLAGAEPSAASDIFGLAATVLELATGRSVYQAPPGLTISELSDRAATALSELDLSGLPPSLVEPLGRALDARPEQRPSAEELSSIDVFVPVGVRDAADGAAGLDEDIAFTLYRPDSVRPETWYDLLAFAHKTETFIDESTGDIVDPLERVSAQAAAVLGDRMATYDSKSQDSLAGLPEGSDLCFVPEMAGVEFKPRQRPFQWFGPVHQELFKVRAASHLDGQVARGQMRVYLGGAVIAAVNLAIPVSSAVGNGPKVPKREPFRRSHKIFVSYSHLDHHVVSHVMDLDDFGGIKILWDKDIETGEIWSDRLARMIEESDTFQLFWSTNSMVSEYVRQEWTHALGLGREKFIYPVYWEEPRPERREAGLPPIELDRIQFGRLPGSWLPNTKPERATPATTLVDALSPPVTSSPAPAPDSPGLGAATLPAPPTTIPLSAPTSPSPFPESAATRPAAMQIPPPGGPFPGYAGPTRPKPRSARRSSRVQRLLVAAAGFVAVVVVASTAMRSHASRPGTTALPTIVESTTVPTHSTEPSGITPLIQLLPNDVAPPSCSSYLSTPPGLVGLRTALICSPAGLQNGQLFAFQFDNTADYLAGLAVLNRFKGFDPSRAGTSCPPLSAPEGSLGWHSNTFPSAAGQILECLSVGSNNTQPDYIWTYPSENAIMDAQGADGSSFSALDTWWTNHAPPP